MTREVNCMNCMIGNFKDDLCDEKMCEALKRIGKSDDFVDIIMLAKEIVRCKDCRYFKKIVERSSSGLCHRDLVASAWKENGYCSRGERKGGDDEWVTL